MHTISRTLLAPIAALMALLLAALGPDPANAQPALRPDPLDARAASAPLEHRSALANYRRWAVEAQPVPWRAANDAVERIGGWRTYAREAHAPAAPTPAPVAPGAAPGLRTQP